MEPEQRSGTIRVWTRVRARDRTGVEMESLTAAAVAALSLYDTAKAYDRAARIDGLRLLAKSEASPATTRARADPHQGVVPAAGRSGQRL